MTVVTYVENVLVVEFQAMIMCLTDICDNKFINYFDSYTDLDKSQVTDKMKEFLDEYYYMFNHQESFYHLVETDSKSFTYSEDESFYEKYDTDDDKLFYYDIADYKNSQITVDTDDNTIVELIDSNPKSSTSVLKLTDNQIEYFYHKIMSIIMMNVCVA